MRTIYLDYNATTPLAPAVQEAMLPFLAEHYGNPSSSHALGCACREAVADARSRVASLVGADSDEIVFTSGGTEANNLALKGLAFRRFPVEKGRLVISAFEHPSVAEPARFLERLGFTLSMAPTSAKGVVDPRQVAAAIRPDTLLVSVMHANNEIGVVQPIREIAEVCRQRGVLLHTDAAQSVGKIRVSVAELGVDLLSIAGHKLYAPKGVGALYVRRSTTLEPLLHGSAHERGLRAGTENVASIVGLGHAAALAEKSLAESGPRLAMFRDRLQNRLQESIGKGLTINGRAAERLPNTLSINFPGVTGGALLRRLPELCASSGAACHSGSTQMSPTLAAIGLSPEVARGAVRLSLGWYTSEEEIDRAASLLIAAWEALH